MDSSREEHLLEDYSPSPQESNPDLKRPSMKKKRNFKYNNQGNFPVDKSLD